MARLAVIDLETEYSLVEKVGKKKLVSDYGDCFNPNNKIVLVGVMDAGTGRYVSFDFRLPGRLALLKKHLAQYEGFIGHNIKYDLLWLKQVGIDLLDKRLYDTMLLEYIRLQGRHKDFGLSLNVVAPRYGGTAKIDVIKMMWEEGINTSDIPTHLLAAYLYDDCNNTRIIFSQQIKDPSIKAQAEFCRFYMDLLVGVTQMEYDGAKFNDNLLDSVADDIDTQLGRATTTLSSVIADLTKGHDINGGKPINLDSPAQLMPIMYSLKLKEDKKEEWKKFIARFRPQRTGSQRDLELALSECFESLPYGAGVKPNVSWMQDRKWFGATGLSTCSAVVDALLGYSGLTKKQERLVTALSNYSKASTWKSSNLAGVINGVKKDGYIHGKFNLAVTATRRFSSSEPNMQNWPRDRTNPLKKLVKSRYEGGFIINADYKQLEFRVVGMLADDKALLKDVSEGFDIHTHSAKMAFGDKFTEASDDDKDELRTRAKATTFRFQYGAMPKNKTEQAIYDAFYGKYFKVAQWQEKQEYHISRDKEYRCPLTGSIFAFPEATPNNKHLWLTKAKNYPVQYLAAVINSCGAIGLREALQEYDPRCKWILTVHDSNVIDVPPECLDDVIGIIKDKMSNINPIFSRYFKKELDILLGVDVSYGPTWFDQKKDKTNDTKKQAA